MKKQVLLAALVLTAVSAPVALAHDWWEGKYDRGHHYTWDEWRDHRSAWENEHKAQRHWDEARMRREWENHKHHWHY